MCVAAIEVVDEKHLMPFIRQYRGWKLLPNGDLAYPGTEDCTPNQQW